MLIIKAFHIIAMVAWFAGLFYLPRLFVYHANTHDDISLARFKIMERRLYYGITWPAGITTSALGLWLINFSPTYYLHAGWFHAKLAMIALIWGYHLTCGAFLKRFALDKNLHSGRFFRIYNELPTLLLIMTVLLVVCKPF